VSYRAFFVLTINPKAKNTSYLD